MRSEFTGFEIPAGSLGLAAELYISVMGRELTPSLIDGCNTTMAPMEQSAAPAAKLFAGKTAEQAHCIDCAGIRVGLHAL